MRHIEQSPGLAINLQVFLSLYFKMSRFCILKSWQVCTYFTKLLRFLVFEQILPDNLINLKAMPVEEA